MISEVQNIRNKLVLIQLITTEWCPSIWKEAKSEFGFGSTCSAPRFPSWAKNDLDHDFGIGDWAARAEYRFGASAHGVPHISDVVLDDILDDVPHSTPPDFFAKATV